ncbi:MAG: hypothetical protein GWP19_07860 [Planctomycetia bacterium]|nr:hypothetical protein [Planctomycetia bacterium]
MNIVEVAKKKEEILTPKYMVRCAKCCEEFFSPFDKLYIAVKEECYVCNEDEILTENIFKLL